MVAIPHNAIAATGADVLNVALDLVSRSAKKAAKVKKPKGKKMGKRISVGAIVGIVIAIIILIIIICVVLYIVKKKKKGSKQKKLEHNPAMEPYTQQDSAYQPPAQQGYMMEQQHH